MGPVGPALCYKSAPTNWVDWSRTRISRISSLPFVCAFVRVAETEADRIEWLAIPNGQRFSLCFLFLASCFRPGFVVGRREWYDSCSCLFAFVCLFVFVVFVAASDWIKWPLERARRWRGGREQKSECSASNSEELSSVVKTTAIERHRRGAEQIAISHILTRGFN